MTSKVTAQLRPSKTAELAAAIRALHSRRVSPPILEDNLARNMCGPFWRTVVSSDFLARLVVDGVLKKVSPVMPAIYTRAKFGEERLEKAIREGIAQYVIIGAGYETVAMRRTELAAKLSIYELDLQDTQSLKMKRMRSAGIPVPEQVRYIPTDLNSETVHDALGRSDFDDKRPAVFSWFGVTYYLGEDAIRKTLQTIVATMAPGSSVLFDYLADSDWTDPESRILQESCAEFVAKRGEPWLTSFHPEKIGSFLEDLGYDEVEHLEPKEIGVRYFSDHPQLTFPPFFGFCHAVTAK